MGSQASRPTGGAAIGGGAHGDPVPYGSTGAPSKEPSAQSPSPEKSSPGEKGKKAAEQSDEEDVVPVVFTWSHGGQKVFLAGSFNEWQSLIPLVRSGADFSCVQDIPRGAHQYKFIVDDLWRFSQDQPVTQDNEGNVNNIIDIRNYHKYKAYIPDDREVYQALRYGQSIPDPSEFSTDAPSLPMLMSKIGMVAIDPNYAPHDEPPPTRKYPHVPMHIMANHLFHDQCGLLERHGVHSTLSLSTSHRYNKIYSTGVTVTKSPMADTSADNPNNPFKRLFTPKPRGSISSPASLPVDASKESERWASGRHSSSSSNRIQFTSDNKELASGDVKASERLYCGAPPLPDKAVSGIVVEIKGNCSDREQFLLRLKRSNDGVVVAEAMIPGSMESVTRFDRNDPVVTLCASGDVVELWQAAKEDGHDLTSGAIVFATIMFKTDEADMIPTDL